MRLAVTRTLEYNDEDQESRGKSAVTQLRLVSEPASVSDCTMQWQ